ncbi:LCP family protein [Arcanobacterium phocae]|uniref:Cell envelope-related function transcriptional attenuator common domain-containing protein n=1 Tax=Arcanobacterium phocae TaxID=131112 RepID=A0A1H2LFU9_9ACTO|nr:LCP family protein [Arcanobacterium phocae]SDU79276.1 cell envelope-related function transcriptional attenuator common domain-containing protein [Arcanobacterium phocae]
MEKSNQSSGLPHRSATHQRKRGPWRNRFRILGLTVLALVLGSGTALATMLHELQQSIVQHDLTSLVKEAERPTENQAPLDQKAGKPLNILLLGADRADGGTQRSDTTMLMHIAADRSRIDVVSIPRDTLVDIPPCVMGNGDESYPQNDTMFNAAFSTGGTFGGDVAQAAACTLRTVENLTGVYVDGFAVLNFDSFRDVVDTIGGIDMCFNEAIDDAYSGISLDAGCHHLDGTQALGIARARYSIGDGSDIGRISRQHQVVTAIAKKTFGLNVFTDIPTLYGILKDVTSHMDLSQGLGDIQWLGGLAYSLRNVDPDEINFATMPYYPDGARVRPSQNAQLVWDALVNDVPIPEQALATDSGPEIVRSVTPQQLEEFKTNIGSGIAD